MLNLALLSFVAALISAVFAFGGVTAESSASIAQILFPVFVAAFLASMTSDALRRRDKHQRPRDDSQNTERDQVTVNR